jgi:type II secretory pathway component PulF
VKARRRVLAPRQPLLGRVPGIGSWARDHDVSLWMRYLALLLDAGATPESAAAVATKLAGEPGRDHRPRLLSSAATLGRLREELARLLDEDTREAAERFEEPRNGLVIGLRALIYLIVSAFLVAMYLPIFKLGSII